MAEGRGVLPLREAGSIEELHSILEAGFAVIEHFAPDVRRLVSTTAQFSRMVIAMAPVHQVSRPRVFLYVLGQSAGLVWRFVARVVRQRIHGHAVPDREREQISAMRQDLGVLSDEGIQSYRALVRSLAEGEWSSGH